MDETRREEAWAKTLPSSERLMVVSGRFELRRRLGRGASKDVYLARDRRLDRDVAISFVLARWERLDREARLLALLDEHPNVVTIHDLGESDGVPYVVARYMAGGSLAERLARSPGRRLAVGEAAGVAAAVAAALAHVHARGVFHRDVKPGNIWLDAEGRAALGDFGVALAEGEPPLTGSPIGTPAYMAPEQAAGAAGDARSDLYSLGATLYELLCGAPPFTGDTVAEVIVQHAESEPPRPTLANPAVAAPLERLVLALLAKDPDARPESAAAVQAALRAADPDSALGRRRRAGSLVNAIPPPPTRTIGRGALAARVEAELQDPATRLLTLTGPGGVGKTRLATDVGRTAGGRLVGLASVAAAEQVPAAICDALLITRIPDESADEALVRALTRERMLLVLDNLEHLLDAAPLVAALLEYAPGIKILATSREPLTIQAERVLPVPPLDLPVEAGPAAAAAPAVELFAQSARARDPGFALTPQTLPHVVEICRRLDGLPLAIELAAARLGLLDVAGLAPLMRDALSRLASGPRDAPERQRTLRATLDWSFKLLDADEGDAFTALGAFTGGCELDAAVAVTGQPLEVLEALTAKSLVIADAGRLRLLEPIRQYATALLAERPDVDRVRARHLRHYLALAEDAEPEIYVRGPSMPVFDRLHRDHENLRAATVWALEHGSADQALRIVAALGRYWERSSDVPEQARWCELAIASAGEDTDERLLARAYLTWAFTRAWTGDEIVLGTRALELFRTADDARGTAECLIQLGIWQSDGGDLIGGRRRAEEALDLARRLEDEFLLGMAYRSLALSSPRIRDGLPYVAEAAGRLRRAGALHWLAGFLTTCGFSALREDEYELADRFQAEALAAARTLDSPYLLALVHGNRALAALLAGRQGEATVAFREQLRVAHEHVLITFHMEAFLGLAALAAAAGDFERAALLEAAAWDHNDRPVSASEQPVYDRVIERFLDPARTRLGPEAWERAAEAGRGLTLERAVELART